MRLRASAGGSKTDKFKARLILAAYAGVNALINLFRILLWPRPRPRMARAVCVYKIGNLGDIVCALPALSAIRAEYPTARLVFLTSSGQRGRPGARAVLSGINWVDEFIEYYPEEISHLRGAARFISKLRHYDFDIFIEFPNDTSTVMLMLRNIAFARFVGARWAGGWKVNTLRVALQKQSEQIEFPNEVRRLLRIVENLGITTDKANLSLPTTPDGERQAAAVIERLNLPRGRRLIALAPGAKRPGSQWPFDRFAEVGRRLGRAGYHLLVLGSPAERELGERICELVGSGCTNVAGETDVAGAAALMRRCDLAICNDSGLQHLASAVGTPCVTIFSFWHIRGKWWPDHPQAIVLQKMVPCHTCFLQHCPFGDECVTETSTTEVVDAAFSILEAGSRIGENNHSSAVEI